MVSTIEQSVYKLADKWQEITTLQHGQDQKEEEGSYIMHKMVRRYLVGHCVDSIIVINKYRVL